jgi:O-antigen/teichoic acid export membrane protein
VIEPEPEPTEPTNLTETVVRGAGLAGAGFILAQVLTLGFYFALARLASPSDFGDFTAGSLLVGVGLLFTEGGMMAAVIHRKDRVDEAASTAVIACAVAGTGFALLALAASPLLGLFFHSDTVGKIAAATSGLLFLRSFQVVPEALLQRRFSFLRRMIVEPAGVLAFGISAVIACSNGLGPWGLVIGYYAAAVTDVGLSWALVGWRPKLRLASIAMWRDLVGYGRFVLASVAIMRLGEQIPVLLIGRALGTGPLGQFRYSWRMALTPLQLVVQAGAYVLFPALARIRDDRERLRDASLRSLRGMCAIGFPLGLLLVPLGIPAAVILFGHVWRPAGEAAIAFSIFCIGATLISWASEVVKADGRPDIQARIHVISVVTGAVAMFASLPFDSLILIVAGFSLGSLIGGCWALWRVAQLLEIPLPEILREVLPPALAGALMAALLFPIEALLVDASDHGVVASIVLLGAEALLGLAIYAAALFVVGRPTFRELASAVSRLIPGRGTGQPPVEPA